MAGTARPYVSANYSLMIDGFDCGIIQKFGGGTITAEVQEIAQNYGYFTKKAISGIKYDKFKCDMAGVAGGPLYAKIEALLAADHQYFNGAIHALDFNLKTKAIREFTNSLLTAVNMPECDASQQNKTAYLNVEFEAEKIRNLKGDDSAGSGATPVVQKKLTPANFSCKFDAIADAMHRVSKFSGPKITAPIQRDNIGFAREYELCPAKGVQFANLNFSVASVDADPIYAWHQKFVVDGFCSEADETGGELVYYSQSLKDALITVTFHNVGIFGCGPESDLTDQADAISRTKVDLYCEKMTIKFDAK